MRVIQLACVSYYGKKPNCKLNHIVCHESVSACQLYYIPSWPVQMISCRSLKKYIYSFLFNASMVFYHIVCFTQYPNGDH